ncbi:MAG: adenylate kinase [Euryarchaeota archaeon]|nr:adenylate kinase [Euryarchaeota archaeon]
MAAHNRFKVVVVTGLPGVGKSTVMKGSIEQVRQEGIQYQVVNYGDVMLNVAKERKLVEHRDGLRKLPAKVQRDVQRMAGKSIAIMAETNPIIVDTHSVIKTPEGFLPGLPKWVLDELQPNVIVLIEADPEEIARRRAKDQTRFRDAESLESIQEHIVASRAAAMAYAALCGATVKIIKNNDGKIDEAIQQMLMALR